MWEIVLIRDVDQVQYENRLYSHLFPPISFMDELLEESLDRDQRNESIEERMGLLEQMDSEVANQLRRHIQTRTVAANREFNADGFRSAVSVSIPDRPPQLLLPRRVS